MVVFGASVTLDSILCSKGQGDQASEHRYRVHHNWWMDFHSVFRFCGNVVYTKLCI